MQDEAGIFENAKKGSLLIDCSTIDPLASQALAEEAMNKYGLNMIDAPVSGGVTGAAAGTLTFMVGGDEKDVTRATPVLDRMGKAVIHCGTAGKGGSQSFATTSRWPSR